MAYETITVNELLNFIGELHSIPDSELQRKKQEYLSLFNMEAYKDEYIGSLSKGILQRTIICSVMIREPQVFLLDEPFYGLDPSGNWQFKRLLMELRDDGRTTLLCTHTLSFVEELCDVVTIINNGAKVVEGSLQDLRQSISADSSFEESFLKLTEGVGES
jgi:ABC-2 type transport system ATP-binding protein